MDHQDWNTVVLSKPKPKSTPVNLTKHTGINNKLDGDDPPPPKTISLNKRQEFIKLRNSKQMTQKQLAFKLNIQQNDVVNFESGKTVISDKILNKMRNLLNK